MSRRTIYQCTVLGGGTQTAGPSFRAMFDAWGKRAGVQLVNGTLNLCSSEEPDLPDSFISLKPELGLAPRRGATLSPRLYPVLLNGRQDGWLYRWSEHQDIDDWVGVADGCPNRHRWEIVAEVHLKTALDLEPGDKVEVEFV